VVSARACAEPAIRASDERRREILIAAAREDGCAGFAAGLGIGAGIGRAISCKGRIKAVRSERLRLWTLLDYREPIQSRQKESHLSPTWLDGPWLRNSGVLVS